MTDNSRNSNEHVDRADLSDLEDDSSIPTYNGPSPSANSTNASEKLGSLYHRTGRTAPQKIDPAQPKQEETTETASFERPDQQAGLATGRGGADAPTTVTRAASANHSDALASDAPTTHVPAQHVPAQPVAQAQPTRQLDRPEEPAPVYHDEPNYESQPYTDSDFAPAGAAAAGVGAGAGVAAAPVDEQPVYAEQPQIVEDARRGTLDFGLLIIRVVIGAYLIVRGVFTFFTLGGSEGLAGLEAQFAGYQYPEILAILLPSIELAAGVFLLLGLMTPVAAAVATIATSFTTLHEVNIHEGGWGQLGEPLMLALILTLVVVGLQFTGPGRISLDSGRGWARRPLVSSWIFVILGIAGAVVLWWFGAGVNPIA
ncbi:hypothetical protein CDES_06145 [Corynebacterium deserti GIMN1.010]|uniref:DoxX family protein n=1 Tax=Corynebacterium deserti GIMN1.010 TaxID=931089 RepID=A0A0M4CXJ3_9CORY|nr:DoxX family protein [Corynebacterium deserti]ALC05657.1 hypothetical protein CDES_06145 [Corynebacterium deserti GIMN1.010]